MCFSPLAPSFVCFSLLPFFLMFLFSFVCCYSSPFCVFFSFLFLCVILHPFCVLFYLSLFFGVILTLFFLCGVILPPFLCYSSFFCVILFSDPCERVRRNGIYTRITNRKSTISARGCLSRPRRGRRRGTGRGIGQGEGRGKEGMEGKKERRKRTPKEEEENPSSSLPLPPPPRREEPLLSSPPPVAWTFGVYLADPGMTDRIGFGNLIP